MSGLSSFLMATVVAVAMFGCTHVGAHPTLYPEVAPETCQNWPPPRIHSYHIHVQYMGNNANSTAQALALRNQFIETFKPNGTCPTQYHQDFLCMFTVAPAPSGPFVTAQWAAFVPPAFFHDTVTWIIQRRRQVGWIDAACRRDRPGPTRCGVERPSFSVLIHPNSGCEYEDHSHYTLWGGQPMPINMDAMDTENPFDNDETR
eukprot:m.232346 g.232346  ORF g.232346 m.232346 type:complete len:203 (-) comp18678_c0_seq1:38-646(-)